MRLASNCTIVACHAVPFHHCWVVAFRIATRTFVTDRSSVAVPENRIGDVLNTWLVVGVVTLPFGVCMSTGGGEHELTQ